MNLQNGVVVVEEEIIDLNDNRIDQKREKYHRSPVHSDFFNKT